MTDVHIQQIEALIESLYEARKENETLRARVEALERVALPITPMGPLPQKEFMPTPDFTKEENVEIEKVVKALRERN